MVYRSRKQETRAIRGKRSGEYLKNNNIDETVWEYVLASIEKQAKGARQDGMGYQAKKEGFMANLR